MVSSFSYLSKYIIRPKDLNLIWAKLYHDKCDVKEGATFMQFGDDDDNILMQVYFIHVSQSAPSPVPCVPVSQHPLNLSPPLKMPLLDQAFSPLW